MDKIPTIIFYARRVPSFRGALVETLASVTGVLENKNKEKKRYKFLSFLDRNSYDTLSYTSDWLDAFVNYEELDVTTCNIVNLIEFKDGLNKLAHYPLIVILHSAAGDNLSLLNFAINHFKNRKGKIINFFGNEYSLMNDKIFFAKEIEADYIASQLPSDASAWLYSECKKSEILHAPPALNPSAYYSRNNKRLIDIGFKGNKYPLFIGDIERTNLINYFIRNSSEHNLVSDIKYERITKEKWCDFLNNCKAIIGGEAGTYYLEKDNSAEQEVNSYLEKNASAGYEEVYKNYFLNRKKNKSGKAISSRHFESIGTKTCQILLEGDYNGLLSKDVHYIPVKKDLSDIKEAIEKFQDIDYRNKITEDAYEYVMLNHTYNHRIKNLVDSVKNRINH